MSFSWLHLMFVLSCKLENLACDTDMFGGVAALVIRERCRTEMTSPAGFSIL